MTLARLLSFGAALCAAVMPLCADAGPTVLAKGLFSYQAPPGWTLLDSSLSKFPVSIGKASNGLKPNIFVAMRSFPGGLPDYTATFLTALRGKFNTTIVDQQPFVTSAGLDGNRIVTRQPTPSVNAQIVYYLFDGGGGNKLMIAAACAASDAKQDTPLFDAAVKSFTLE